MLKYLHFIPLSGTETAQLACVTRDFLVIYLFFCMEVCVSNLLDSDDREICWFLPASSLGGSALGGEADVACSGMASEASGWEH